MNTIITRDLTDFAVPFAYLQPKHSLYRLCAPDGPDLLKQGYRIAMYPNTGYSFLVRMTGHTHVEAGIRFHILEAFELDQQVNNDGTITACRGYYKGSYYVNPDFINTTGTRWQFAQP